MGFVFFDTETTGLGNDAQIIQIGVLDVQGNVLGPCRRRLQDG